MGIIPIKEILALLISGILGLFFAFRKVKKDAENNIENKQLKEQSNEIAEWKKTSNYFDRIGSSNLNRKLRDWKESERKNHDKQ